MDNNALVDALVALKPLLSKIEDNSVAIASIDNRLYLLMEEVSKLQRILYEGNGQPSITARMATIETGLVSMKDSIYDQKKEAKEAITEVMAKLHKVDKASSEIGIAFEELQDMEKGKRAASDARDLVNYGWKLQVLQAVLLLLLTSGVGFASKEVYNYYSHRRTFLQPKGTPIIEPTQK
ncbi:hypothetical protein [Microcoleus phage My-WqHQDG]|nr:hypothetical protein [Microcoleus phage My-WqHQDG]